MKFGLQNKDYLFIKETFNRTFSIITKSDDVKIWCFGSRARGDYKKFSDLDLMIESEKDCQQQIGTVNAIFEESALPIKVDIIQLQDFAKSYKANFLKDRVLF